MSIEKMHEEFEAWFEANKHFMLGTRKVSKGDCLFIWQASRAALVIELPSSPYMPDAEPADMTPYEIGEAQGRCDMWVMSREAIEAAGVKVKP